MRRHLPRLLASILGEDGDTFGHSCAGAGSPLDQAVHAADTAPATCHTSPSHPQNHRASPRSRVLLQSSQQSPVLALSSYNTGLSCSRCRWEEKGGWRLDLASSQHRLRISVQVPKSTVSPKEPLPRSSLKTCRHSPARHLGLHTSWPPRSEIPQ